MMKKAGFIRIFFGIESGNDQVLAMMDKGTTTKRAKEAVSLTKQSGIQTGAFFIVGYPGETDQTVLDTVNFSSSLPLDYLSFTLPYPIPGTPLFERVKDKIEVEEWEESNSRLIGHRLLYRSNFTESSLKFAIVKGTIQHQIKKQLKNSGYKVFGIFFEKVSDYIFKLLS
jgi:anaerobic magnesium-protoporphyrin IX monomethyl ester cyclase